MSNRFASLTFAALIAVGSIAATSAMAQTTDTTVPGHPRINQVDQRLQNQQNRETAGAAQGTINARQEARDSARDNKVQGEMAADEAKNGGTLTKGEQNHMNNQLNRNSADIKAQRAQ